MNNEPSLEQIEDYNNNESPKKRKTVRLVVLFIVAVAIAYGVMKSNYVSTDEYVGTENEPGINIIKK